MSEAEKIKIEVDNNDKKKYLEDAINTYTNSNIEFTLGQSTFILLFIFRAFYLVQTKQDNIIPRASLPLSLFAAGAGTAVAVLARLTLFGLPDGESRAKVKKTEMYKYPEKKDLQAFYYFEIDTNADGSYVYYSDKQCTIKFENTSPVKKIDDTNPVYNLVTNSINGTDISNAIKIRTLETGKSTLEVELEISPKSGNSFDKSKKIAVAISDYSSIKEIENVNEIIMEETVETEIYEIYGNNDTKVTGLAKQTLKRYFKLKKNTDINNIYLVVSGYNSLNKSNNSAKLLNSSSENIYFIKDKVPEIDDYNKIFCIIENIYDTNKKDNLYFNVVNKNNQNDINPLGIALDYGNPPRNVQFSFLAILVPFAFLNTNLRRRVFQMDYFKGNNNTLNYNLFEELLISAILVGNIGFVIKRSCDIISGLLKISRVKKVIDELSKQELFIKGGDESSEIIEGTELENLDNRQVYPLLYTKNSNKFNNNLEQEQNNNNNNFNNTNITLRTSTKKLPIKISNILSNSISKIIHKKISFKGII